MQQITIDPEFQALIPPLSAEERAQLEANLLADGCRDPLVVWVAREADQERDIAALYVLVDGHNRYEICTRNDIEYGIEEMLFDSREDVIVWMVDNQRGRRNLNDFQRTELQLKKKSAIAAKARANQQGGQGGVLLSQNSAEAIDTRKETTGASDFGRAACSWARAREEAWLVPKNLGARLVVGAGGLRKLPQLIV